VQDEHYSRRLWSAPSSWAHAEHRSAIEDSADGSHAPAADDDAATEGEPSEEIDREPHDEAKERASEQ
jgi:hypothetical protein